MLTKTKKNAEFNMLFRVGIAGLSGKWRDAFQRETY